MPLLLFQSSSHRQSIKISSICWKNITEASHNKRMAHSKRKEVIYSKGHCPVELDRKGQQ